MQKGGYVYIVTNAHHTVLYTGVTSDLIKRIYEHKHKLIKGFSHKYNCNKLVYWEKGEDIYHCIQREKQIKSGSRKKKEYLIEKTNPNWLDLSEDW